MPTYKVKSDRTFGKSREHKAGDTIMLTEQEAAGVLDKLQLISPKGEPDRPPIQVEQPKAAVKPPVELDKIGLDEKLVKKLAEAGYTTVQEVYNAGDGELKEKVGLTGAQVGVVRERVNANIANN